MISFLQKERVKKTVSIALPAALNSLLDMLNILIDLIMVGVISSYATVAVGVGMNFVMIVFSIITIFFVGTNAIISRFYGAKNLEESGSALFSIVIFAFLVSIPVMILSLYFSHNFYDFIGVSLEAKELGVPYLIAISLSFPALFSKVVFISALSACGDTRLPFFVKIVGSLLNILLNYLLIYGYFGFPELGVLGAGISTAFVHLFELIILYYILKKGVSVIKINRNFNISHVKRALKVGIPTGFERFFTFLSFILFSKFIASYGTFALAGYQIGIRAEGIAFMPGVGFMIASMALMGQSLGAKDEEEAQKYIYTTLFLASIVMGVIGLFFILSPEVLVSLFSTDKETIEEASKYLFIIGFSQIPLAMFFVYDGALRGAGATKITFLVNTISIWTLRVIPAYLLTATYAPLISIFIVITAETFIRAFVLYLLFKKGVWRGISV